MTTSSFVLCLLYDSMQIADLQIHSRYSRATSPNMVLPELAKAARLKGITLLGTGDITHPRWLVELKENLAPVNDGIFTYDDVSFLLQGEIALIYTHNGGQRRVHHLILAPSFDVVDQINAWLDTKGRRDYDGRPIFGFTSIELVEAMRAISHDIEIIPAHAWTSWYSIFGSKSGFDSVEECFEDQAQHIHAIETGMSSTPAMNWRLSSLDRFTMISNSDAHSPYPWRLGREANVFDLRDDFTYHDVLNAIRFRKHFAYTIETPPAYGKYHYDGHRACNFSCDPATTRHHNGVCPSCNHGLTIGVQSRVEELADRQEGFVPRDAVPFTTLLPLSELIAAAVGQDVFTKKVWALYHRFVEACGTEFAALLDASHEQLERIDPAVAQLVVLNRDGTIRVTPGYDGVYGKIIPEQKRTTLSDFV